VNKAKPFIISEMIVREAFKAVKANDGSPGVDGITIEEFEKDLNGNLYKIWNRMASGTYFPPAVRMEEIPKDDGKMRQLGIPTVSDRVAQTVAKMYLEPSIDPIFHPDSFGYRPRKSAIQALEVARKRCWKYNWVIDLDIKGFFDNMDHELVMKAVRKHTDKKWILLYVERWLKAPSQQPEGTLVQRDKGTPQGGVISPLLANLFLHYVFDEWMKRNHPDCPFERYADDVVVHCNTEAQAQKLLGEIRKRMAECKLELHPDKTKIVYCKDDSRKGNYPNESFDFLGYTFRARKTLNKREGTTFIGFNPAISNKAVKKIKDKVRKWDIHKRTHQSLEEFAQMMNSVVRGWINYYGTFFQSELVKVLRYIDRNLAKWAKRKYKTFKGSLTKANEWLERLKMRDTQLFVHWKLTVRKNGSG
jgi:RNA-directed DNA polymerase